MADNLTKKQRSVCMSRIKSKWTKPEFIVHNHLKGYKIKHKMHPNISGNPDVLIEDNLAVFIHGCFWHKCPKCFTTPKSNKDYWSPKLRKNVIRDKRNRKLLKAESYTVVTIWEHDVRKNLPETINKLLKNARKRH